MKEQIKDMSQWLEAMSVSTGQYRARMDGGIYGHFEEVPDKYRPVLETGRDGDGTYDYARVLNRGKDWLIEPLRALQPQSFQAFQEVVGPLLLGIVLIKDLMNPEGPPLVAPVMFFDASGRMVEVHPDFPGNTYEEGNDRFGTLLALPEALAKSWLWRVEGWRVPSEPFQGPIVNRRLIGYQWRDADNYLDSLGRGWKKRYLPLIVERFPDTKTNENGIKRIEFSCFLDTRPAGLNGPVGDQLFVCLTRRDQLVYHVRQGDVENMRILRNPADAVDRYCAHVLRRLPGEFDFSPWSEPMEA